MCVSVVQICGAGESYAASEKLSTDENRIAEELKKHQVTQHGHSPILTAKTPATKSHSNLEEQIRRRAYEISQPKS